MSKPEKLIAQINEFLDGKISKNELKEYIDNFSFEYSTPIIWYLIGQIKN